MPPSSEEVTQEPIPRRKFLSWVLLGWVSAIGVLSVLGGSLIRFFFPNVVSDKPQQCKVGPPASFSDGVDSRFKDKYGIWLIRGFDPITNQTGIYALLAICTHLGCAPDWREREGKFRCPCHGSGFFKTGIHFEGPAPRPLERLRIFLAEDGQIVVDRGKKYLYEKGEWTQPEAFLSL